MIVYCPTTLLTYYTTVRQDDEIWQKLKAYEELLLKLVSQVDDDDQQAIQKAILMVQPLYCKTKNFE